MSESPKNSPTKSTTSRSGIPALVGGVILVCLLGTAWYFSPLLTSTGGVLTIYGDVDIREVNLGFRVPGRVASVLKDEGDRVNPGDLLAMLDKTPYEDAVAERLADVAAKTAIFDNADAVYGRDKVLLPTGGVSQQVADTDRFAREQASASLAMSKAQLTTAQTDLRDTELHSPSAGVITTRAEEPGAIVQMNNNVLTLDLDQPVWVRAYVPESNLGDVNPSKDVEVFTDSQPKRAYHGKIGFVSPVAEFTPKAVETTELRTSLIYRIRIVIQDPDAQLRQGMPCTVKIIQ